MTYQTNCTLPEELLEQIAQQGFDVLPELIRTVINMAMQIERQNIWARGRMNGQMLGKAMPMGTSRKRCLHEWVKSPLRIPHKNGHKKRDF